MEVLRAAILDMLRRKKDESFASSEVVLQMYPEDWEQFLEEVNSEAIALSREGLIIINDDELDPSKANSLKISSPNKL
ncbi:DUF3253 domain-containing protein [Algoriphagus antarcticus]|uniref:Uncharacterized protein DUF3253 n=1 Tax=Algoriphagus antarcticus TaxID=238540 RepID=A0A3E0E563_9BACT|nr:DUF3253 domain-containing protein [Algoriphagus antarcticus]REG92750.1 uncharacterized protein DUF3253 [Algoriphagus antarcticus]